MISLKLRLVISLFYFSDITIYISFFCSPLFDFIANASFEAPPPAIGASLPPPQQLEDQNTQEHQNNKVLSAEHMARDASTKDDEHASHVAHAENNTTIVDVPDQNPG